MTIVPLDNPFKRLVGLMGRRSLPDSVLYVLSPCDSVHTFWMKLPIDILFLSRDNEILAIHRAVAAGRVLTHKGAFAVAEGRGGIAEALQLNVGDILR